MVGKYPNLAARKQISNPTRPRYGSDHVGMKSKQVLEQEIFSLENLRGKIKSPEEQSEWEIAFVRTVGEYARRFGLDPLTEWRKWAKS